MFYIRHRINTLNELKTIDVQHGCEIDLRTDVRSPSKIHLSHDAWVLGDSFDTWLDLFKKRNVTGTLILNTKEDGLEDEAIFQCKARGIENYFFLDTALPTFIKYTNTEHSQLFAARLSAFEDKKFILQFGDKIKWIWADCFNGIPLSTNLLKELHTSFQICLVSPELQKVPAEEILKFKHLLPYLHSICTKRPELWQAQ